jgi:amino acid adenylation domain-containing protein
LRGSVDRRSEPAAETRSPTLAAGFFSWAAEAPTRAALEVEGHTLTYGDLARRARSLADALLEHDADPWPPLTAVLGERSVTAFAGILAASARGHGYVPLSPQFPARRNRTMLERSDCRAVVVDSASVTYVDRLIEGLDRELLFVVPDEQDVERHARRWAPHRVVGAEDLGKGDGVETPLVRAGDPAYLLFTSGSTGAPKGVLVTQANVRAFLDAASRRYGITVDDRFSQTFNLTFDLSVFDMFVAWDNGACVCCPSEKSLLKPSDFIRRARLSVWFSVPSIALFMRRLGVLKPAAFPTLRWSLFCGEALPVDVARDWANAAPDSIVENLYGPTEATIACTAYRWNSTTSVSEAELGIVPIGHPFPGMSMRVVDDYSRDVQPGEVGELLLSGPQVMRGYWKDEAATSASFASLNGRAYYRTGDRVRRPRDDGPLTYVGRLDGQVKVLGHRVELGEVEAALREETGVDAAVAVGWPRSPAGVAGIAAFVAAENIDLSALRDRLALRLPSYMVPRELRLVREMPTNANGKWDRGALVRLLEERR